MRKEQWVSNYEVLQDRPPGHLLAHPRSRHLDPHLGLSPARDQPTLRLMEGIAEVDRLLLVPFWEAEAALPREEIRQCLLLPIENQGRSTETTPHIQSPWHLLLGNEHHPPTVERCEAHIRSRVVLHRVTERHLHRDGEIHRYKGLRLL